MTLNQIFIHIRFVTLTRTFTQELESTPTKKIPTLLNLLTLIALSLSIWMPTTPCVKITTEVLSVTQI
jgi:hypothetical protein